MMEIPTSTAYNNNKHYIVVALLKMSMRLRILQTILCLISIRMSLGEYNGYNPLQLSSNSVNSTHISKKHHNPMHNTSSHEFKLFAKRTYDRVLPCVVNQSWMYENKDVSKFAFPDDAQEHFEEIYKRTAGHRNGPVHEYASYEGPWIENQFISKYHNRSLHTFGGLIPIFVQWIDFQILRGRHFDHIYNELTDILRPNVLYVTITQGDVGLGKIGMRHPNILALSAGGFGHVPLPLIKGEIAASAPPEKFEQDIGFFGTTRQATRPEMLAVIKATADELSLTFKQGSGSSWQHDMEFTKFNLAPRGYGRSSFRFAESVQMGRIPVFIHSDLPWIPYQGTPVSIETFGFSAGLTATENTLKDLVHSLKNMTTAQYDQRMDVLKKVRPFYTYEGVFGELDKFLRDPFGPNGGYFRCTVHPRTERCCG